MKKIIYLLAIVIGFVSSSCNKESGSSGLPVPGEQDPFSPVPSTFSKKVLVEEFTAACCGWCLRGVFYFEKLDSIYGSKVIGISYHDNDPMSVQEGSDIETFFGPTGIPNSVVDRGPLEDPSSWLSDVPTKFGVYIKCGLAID